MTSSGRGRDDVELELVPVERLQQARQEVDVPLQANLLAHLPQILSPDSAILRIVQQQIRQLGALLHQMHARESGTLFHEPGNTQHLAQGDSGVVEAQRLIEVAHQQVTLHSGLPLLHPALGHIHRTH